MLTLQWIHDGLFLCFLVVLTECTNTDGDGRKTYVVRYKNGDNTIPVTVVLDYKKQAEYVINMNTRTPSKSVTFYDFKQKSIAYKDMRNKECFIGKLTNETLHTEDEVLRRLQNPLEIKPQTLQLDSTRSALNPTEVRNMAGQKIAMFCRKMATWLLQEPSGLIRNRRQAIQRIEKTYSHHGHEKYEYSKYGRETYEESYLPQSKDLHGVSRHDSKYQNSDARRRPSPQVVDQPALNKQQIRHRIPPSGYPDGHAANNDISKDKVLSGLSSAVANRQLYSHPLRYNNGGIAQEARNSSILLYQPPHQSSARIPAARGLDAVSGPSYGQRVRQPPNAYRHPTGAGEPYYRPRSSSLHSTGNLSYPSGQVHPLQARNFSLLPILSEATTNSPAQIVDVAEGKAPLSVAEQDNGIINGYQPGLSGGIVHPSSNRSRLSSGRELEINPRRNGTQNRKRIDSDVILRPNLYDLNKKAYDRDVTSTNERIISAINKQPSSSLHKTNFGSSRHTVTGNHRADIPSEDSGSFIPSARNGVRSRLNTTRNDGRLMPLPGIIPKNGRHQNVLKLFTPDEIVIDVGKIPKKPEFPLTNVQKKQPTIGSNAPRDRAWDYSKAGQVSGRVWHRTYNNGQLPARSNQPNDYHRNRAAVYGRRRPALPPVLQPQIPQVALPPGVSVYPRHPNAPFADLADTSDRRPVLAPSNVYPQMPSLHRQRHLRKKQRSFQACCALGNGANQQQCCSRQSMLPQNHQSFARSCCSSTKTSRRVKQHRQRASQDSDQFVASQSKRTTPTTEEMCDMKKMCRTLYQSTQAVKVCRQQDVPGC